MYPPPSRLHATHDDPDAPVRATDNDAALARLSAVSKRYLNDPYIAALVPRAHLQEPRPPLINIGTYLRGQGIDELVDGFLRSAGDATQVQIVSLGAGSDTRFWRLAAGPHKDRIAKYVELDFPDNTTRKAMAIRKSRVLSPALGSPDVVSVAAGGTALRSPVYNLLPVDLRHSPESSLRPLLASPENPLLSPSLPTLLLFECVLVYMTPAASDALIQWFVDYLSAPLGSIVYEMFGLGDSFGRVMLNNLRSRNVELPGAAPYPDLASLSQRFLRLNFTDANALTLYSIRRSHIDPTELDRITKLEMLDEIEELDLVLGHYAISWGIKAPEAADWRNWRIHPKARAVVDEDEYD
ncbi:leucine carboxyl methyltransferase [Auriscalpium vulgare]|uniref:Leucine carboxyl methyltransferase n=1 Tax=Auriscalpium vulgare TaxID=40419 RepID=A0ACB8RFV2_9AGAM|nr:leucine carboxyl methyltransferase [Auriscalpium vulgare]